ncbi:MAG: alpha/beta hydrolase-fold protein [Pirellulales bacterium]
MNRLESLLEKSGAAGSAASSLGQDLDLTDFGAATARKAAVDHPATVFGPVHYERNYAYPLIVWLHGAGQNERQLVKIMPLVSLRNYVAVAPRGVRRADATAAARQAFTWTEHGGDFDLAQQRVFELIDEARRQYHVARHRIFLAGADVGGTTALRLALAHPDRFAGVLSLGGTFPAGRSPLARLVEARRLPIFLAYGREDAAFSDDAVESQLKLFHAGGLQVTLRQYPGAAGIAPQMLSDMDRWTMDLVTGAPARAC